MMDTQTKKQVAQKNAEIAAQLVRATINPNNTSYEAVISTFRKAYEDVSNLVEDNS